MPTGSAPSPGGGVQLAADAQGFRELMLATRDFDKTLATEIRRGIRDAGKVVLGKVATAVRAGSYAADTGMREEIAQGLRLQVSTSQARPGIRIVASSAAMPANKKRMPNVWESETFRHPVFGNTTVWVVESGHRFFFKTVYDNRALVTDQAAYGMVRAAQALGREIG